MFSISDTDIPADELRRQMAAPAAGGYCVFEGWVRNENDGRDVKQLEYEVYEPLAIVEGEKVLREALQKFPLISMRSVHTSVGTAEDWRMCGLGGCYRCASR